MRVLIAVAVAVAVIVFLVRALIAWASELPVN